MEAQKQATVLFAEVSGGPELLRTAGQVSGTRAISDCLERIRISAESLGGKFIRATGSELMLIFDSPSVAAGAASKMHATVEALAPVAGTKLGVQIGFHTGPVHTSGQDVVGETVKLAAALVHQAQRGQTLTTQNTAELLGDSFRRFSRQLLTVPMPMKAADLANDHRTLDLPSVVATMPRATTTMNLRYGDQVVICWRENESVVLGRERGCGLVIDAMFSSRRHCTILYTAEGFVVRDHSSNGTYVTNEGRDEIHLKDEEAPLAAHGWIGFGRSRLISTQLLQFFGK